MNLNLNTTSFKGHSFSETLAMIRLGQIDMPVTVFTVDLVNDLIVVDHGDVGVMEHETHARIILGHYGSAGELVDVIKEDMADWGTGFAAVWFTGERVHYSHREAVDPFPVRTGGTGRNN